MYGGVGSVDVHPATALADIEPWSTNNHFTLQINGGVRPGVSECDLKAAN